MDRLQFRRHRARPHIAATPFLPLIAAIILFAGSAQSPALSFDDIAGRLDDAPDVYAARLDSLEAEKRLALAAYPGDPSFGLVPSASVTTAEGESFGGEKKLTGTVTADIPLGLSADRRVNAAAAADTLLRAEEAENRVRAETYVALLTLYREAWLAQEELGVLESELVAAREAARSVEERFARGSASLNELGSAEDELIDAEVAFREGTLARRLTWLRLVYAAGLERNREETLDPVDRSVGDLPRPPALTAWALGNDPRITAEQNRIADYDREVGALPGVVRPPTLRSGFSGWDQSVSASFNTESLDLGLSYGFPIITQGEIPDTRSGSTDRESWELSFSVVLPIQSPTGERLEGDILEMSLQQSNLAISEVERDLALEIRSRYQQYTLAGEAVADAERSVTFSREILETVRDRRAEGRATEGDLLLVEAQHQRALYRLEAALAAEETAKLLTAEAATYLNELLGSIQ
jgi:outer membrane protein